MGNSRLINYQWEGRIIKWLLDFSGLWSVEEARENVKFIVIFMFMILLSFATIPKLFEEPTGKYSRLNAIFESIYWIASTIALCIYRFNIKLIDQCFNFANNNWKCYDTLPDKYQRIMYDYAVKMKWFNFGIFFTLFISIGAYTIDTLSEHSSEGGKPPLELVTSAWNEFSTSTLPIFTILYMINYAITFTCLVVGPSIDATFVVLVLHCCGQLTIICENIPNYSGETHHKEIKNKNNIHIGGFIQHCSCVKCLNIYHSAVASIVSMIDETFHGIILIRLFINTVNFCSVGYMIKKSQESFDITATLIQFSYILTMNYFLLTFCILGEELLQKNDDIARATLNINWENLNKKSMFPLTIILFRCNKPLKLTAGKYFIVSHVLYKEWIAGAISYASVLIAKVDTPLTATAK